ncbi:CCA tRNA nucleotidyltransferase [Chloroflexota bacterium]
MSEVVNLSGNIDRQLPTELVSFMQLAGQVAQSRQLELYLVGGVVRDLLLRRSNLDLDLVVEGDAIALAKELAGRQQAKITTHPRFGTASLRWSEWSADLATARSESYARPGALPTVKAGLIESDLLRRDFTINAMAVALQPGRYGEVLDLYGGRDDLEHKLIRVLHDSSFTDDATRIWRALRYEQRLDFQMESATLGLIKRDIQMLDTISGDRIRHELELVLKEEFPEKALLRADELGVLARMHPSLRGNGWLAEKFTQARQLSLPDLPPPGLYLALLAYRLSDGGLEQLISYLRLPKKVSQTLRDTIAVKAKIESLSVPGMAPSRIHSILHDYVSTALTANSLATDSVTAAEHIELFRNVLHHVRTALTGADLKKMGVPEGPRIREVLERLREARLDGKVGSKKEEEEMVEGKS